jgi:hypothetical protein
VITKGELQALGYNAAGGYGNIVDMDKKVTMLISDL